MPAVKTGMTPPPMPGMPAPMQPMGGMPPAQNPFAPMPPMPLAGMPPPPMPPMAQGQMPQGQQQQIMGSTAGRRRRFGDALEGMLGRNQGIGSAMPQQQRPMPQMMPQQRMVAPGTPMMRTPSPRPMKDGGIVQYFAPGGDVNQFAGDRPNIREFMDATGASFQEASQALYGSVGSNVDIRDWNAIMSSDDPLSASQAASAQMYSSGAGYATDPDFYDDSGNYNPAARTAGATAISGAPRLQQVGNQVMIVDSQGLPLTGLSPQNAASFGITQADIDAAIESGAISGERAGRFEGVGFVPGDYGNLLVDYSDLGKISKYVNAGGSGGGGSSSSGGGSTVVSGGSGQGSGEMVGDIGTSAGSNEMSALYGPNINIPERVSQYVQNPVTGQITTTNGSTMTAISPIGAINLPARPVELDIFDYLGDPTYGSLLDKQVEGMRDGGAVPRSAMIADEPHMLAYINQDEEALLRSFGGSGIAGPGGIPSYPPDSAINRDYGYTASGHSTDNDDDNNNYYEPPGFDFDNDGVKGEGSAVLDNNTTNPFVDFDDDDDYVVVTPTSDSSDADYVGSGSSETDFTQPVVVTSSGGGGGGSPAPAPPPVYRDRLGREYSSQALADAANRMLDYNSLQNRVVNDARNKVATEFADRGLSQTQEDIDYYTMERLRNLEGDAPFTYAGIGGIGAGPEGGSVGIESDPLLGFDPIASQVYEPSLINADVMGAFLGGIPSLEGGPVINLNKPVTSPPDDDEDYTPSAEQLAKQLEAANQTNVTQGPMSVADQTAALQERYGQFTPDQYDTSRLAGDDYSADQALANLEMEGVLPELPDGTGGLKKASAPIVTDDDTSTPSQTSTQTDSSTTSQDLNKGLGAGTSTDAGQPARKPGESIEDYLRRISGEASTKMTPEQTAAAISNYDRGLGADDDPRRANLAVNAAEAKYLQNLLKEFEFDKNDKMVLKDPNAAEKVLGQVIKNLSLGIVDINDLNQERIQAVLDAYRDTGSFVYDTEGNAIDLKTVADLEKLEKLSAGRGQEPAVVGIRDKDGKVVSFGPDIKNTMEGPVAVDVFSEMSTTTGDDDDTTTTTTDDTGHKDGVCNNPDYVYNPETDKCEPKAEDTGGDLGSPITSAITPRSFDEVLRSVVVPAPRIAPISENIRPMQAGGMVGLNRAADNFIKALAG